MSFFSKHRRKILVTAPILAAAIALVLLLPNCMGKKIQYRKLVEAQKAGDTVLIRNVNVFTGLDSTYVSNQDVWIENGRITGIGRAGTYKRMPRTVIEGEGKFLFPGFIDSHVHVTASGGVPWQKAKPDMEHNLQAYLYGGVTTVYDMGGMPSDLKKAQENIRNGKWTGPEIFMAGSPITGPGSHPIPLIGVFFPAPMKAIAKHFVSQCGKPEEAAGLIEKKLEDNPDYIKLICDQLPPGSPELSEECLVALIGEAHKKGKKVFVHIGDGKEAMAAVRGGAEVLAHIPYRGGFSEADATELAAKGTKIIFTLAGFEGVADMCAGSYQPSQMEKEASDPYILDPITGEGGRQFCGQPVLGGFATETAKHQNEWETIIRNLEKYNVQMLIGTDSPIPGAYEGGAFHRELEALSEAGVPNWKLMIAATSAPAKTLFTEPDFGILQAGKKADMVLLNADPLQDIRASQNIEWVMRGGKMYKRIRP